METFRTARTRRLDSRTVEESTRHQTYIRCVAVEGFNRTELEGSTGRGGREGEDRARIQRWELGRVQHEQVFARHARTADKRCRGKVWAGRE